MRSDARQPELSIIIINWNGATLLNGCLTAVERWRDGIDIEVVAFDNGSSDESLEVLEDWRTRIRIQILRSITNLGYAQPNNRAWERSHGEFCLFLNNDAVLGGSLRAAVRYMRSHPHIAACQGIVFSADGTLIDSVGSFMTPFGFLSYPGIQRQIPSGLPAQAVFAAKGVAMYVRRTAIEEIGLFDESSFAYFEETDWCWRARLAGWGVEFSPELPPVYHVGGASSSRLPASLIEFHSFKNRIRSIVKNSSWKTLLTMLPLHLILCVALSIGSALTGRAVAVENIGRALLWNVKVLPETLRKRKSVQSLRHQPDKDVFKGVLRGARPGEMFFLATSYQRRQKEIAATERRQMPVYESELE